MDILLFAIRIFAAAMLLLFAVGLVRTGVERQFGPYFMSALGARESRTGSALTGAGLAIALQSATAVALLICGFTTAGHLTFTAGLAALLGADLGSAIVVQILALDLGILEPLFLVTGGWLYLKSSTPRAKMAGQIILGLALILVSLHLLREAASPLRDSDVLPALALYIENDALTGFLIGAALAFALHSSVAAILMCVALVAAGGLSFTAGLPVVLGANLGSGLIAVWLTRDQSTEARRIPLANAIARGGASTALVGTLYFLDPTVYALSDNDASALILAHLAFNIALVLIFLPLSGVLEWLAGALLPGEDAQQERLSALHSPMTAVDHAPGTDAAVSVSAVRQDILRMLEEVQRMYRPIMVLIDTYSEPEAGAIRARDETVNDLFSGLRRYMARAARSDLPKPRRKEVRALLDYAIRVEAAGDIVAKRLTSIAKEKHNSGVSFSDIGHDELVELHSLVLAGFGLARHVLLVDDIEAARRLVLDKAKVKEQERASRNAHLKRIERGQIESLGSSDAHLELLRALRELFGHVAAVAYPILYKNGQVLDTRLVNDDDEADG